MASFTTVNYSLRPSKSIQRSLVFEAVQILQGTLDLNEMVYIGFGSIWFTDFQMAHKLLNVTDMVSIEADAIGDSRAVFNQPYRTVCVRNGSSSEILPQLFETDAISIRPWLVWLDYDQALSEESVEDIQLVIENAPPNSILLVTFNARGPYGKLPQRPNRVRALLGRVVPDNLSKDDCNDENLCDTLADLTLDFMKKVAADASRPGGFMPAFRLLYRDSSPMVTVGGILPAKGAASAANAAIKGVDWPSFISNKIVAPNLTLKESSVLQAQLPDDTPLDRARVQSLGFDLEEEQIRAFEKYYRYYPSFAQIVT